jgi:hypothetical protein
MSVDNGIEYLSFGFQVAIGDEDVAGPDTLFTIDRSRLIGRLFGTYGAGFGAVCMFPKMSGI